MKLPDSLKDINPLLDDDNVYFLDEAEVYVVIADVPKKDAWKALRWLEDRDSGVDFDDHSQGISIRDLQSVVFKQGDGEDGEKDWIWWNSYPKNAKLLSKGWIARI